jgi:hypothetical protein
VRLIKYIESIRSEKLVNMSLSYNLVSLIYISSIVNKLIKYFPAVSIQILRAKTVYVSLKGRPNFNNFLSIFVELLAHENFHKISNCYLKINI